MVSDNVLISLISGGTGIIVAYITVRYKKQTLRPKAKDRIDVAFDAYERVIKQQQSDLDRKDVAIEKLQQEIARLKGEL